MTRRRARVCRAPALALLLPLLLALAAPDAPPLCWHALLRCHGEPECALAYRQYLSACEAKLREGGAGARCPSHCIGALIRLNGTRSGPALEACDCAGDRECEGARLAVEPCVPRRHPSDAAGVGCTEARMRCDADAGCRASLAAYLAHCSQLFNGRRCAPRCRDTIRQMLALPGGALLGGCVCDGVERPFCEVIKDNMSRLCGLGGAAEPPPEAEDAYDDEEYDAEEAGAVDAGAARGPTACVALALVPLAFVPP